MRIYLILLAFLFSNISIAQKDSVQQIDLLYYHNNQTSELHYNRAIDFVNERQYSTALLELNKVLEKRPGWNEAYQLSLYCASKIDEKTLYKQLQKAYTLGLNDYSYYLTALYALEAKYLTNSKTFFDIAIEMNPNKADYYRAYAVLLEKMGNLKACVHQYNLSMALEPSNSGLYLDRAAMFLKNELHVPALEDLNRAYKINPRNENVLYALASLHYQRKEFEKAKEFLNSISSPQYNIQRDNLLALIEMQKGKFDEALNIVTPHILNDDAAIIMLNNAGNFCNALDMFYRAESYYSKAIEKGAVEATIYRNRGIVYELLRENEKACTDWEKASKSGDESSETYLKGRCK